MSVARELAEALAALPQGRDARGGAVRLRRAVAGDTRRIYDWQVSPGARRWFRNPESPSLGEHRCWMDSVLVSGTQLLLVIEAGGEPAGVLRLDEAGGAVELSVLVCEAASGRGVGTEAVRLGALLAGGHRVVAEVHPDNAASRRLFAKAGFVPRQGHWLEFNPREEP